MVKVIGTKRDAPPVRVTGGSLMAAGLKGAKPPKPVKQTGERK